MRTRLFTGNILFGFGIVLLFCGIFSTQSDIRAGMFGIPSIYLAEAAVVVMIVGLIVKPRKKPDVLK